MGLPSDPRHCHAIQEKQNPIPDNFQPAVSERFSRQDAWPERAARVNI